MKFGRKNILENTHLVVVLFRSFVPNSGVFLVEVVVLTPDAYDGSACISCLAV